MRILAVIVLFVFEYQKTGAMKKQIYSKQKNPCAPLTFVLYFDFRVARTDLHTWLTC